MNNMKSSSGKPRRLYSRPPVPVSIIFIKHVITALAAYIGWGGGATNKKYDPLATFTDLLIRFSTSFM